LDESALAACLAYVDLNPIRARLAETPETSRFTSAYERIQALKQVQRDVHVEAGPAVPDHAVPDRGPGRERESHSVVPVPADTAAGRGALLSPFELARAVEDPGAVGRAANKGCLPMSFSEYLNLLDWPGRQSRVDTRGTIPRELAPIPERLQIGGEDGWL